MPAIEYRRRLGREYVEVSMWFSRERRADFTIADLSLCSSPCSSGSHAVYRAETRQLLLLLCRKDWVQVRERGGADGTPTGPAQFHRSPLIAGFGSDFPFSTPPCSDHRPSPRSTPT